MSSAGASASYRMVAATEGESTVTSQGTPFSQPERDANEPVKTNLDSENKIFVVESSLRWWIYTSRTLSSWGDRMWSFAVGLYLIDIHPDNLLLSAIYGLVNSGSAVLFGSAIGSWVDRTARLQASRRSLIAQNLMVVCSSLLLYLHFVWGGDVLFRPWQRTLLQTGVILTAVLAQLASTAGNISVTKDWVKVIAQGDTQTLATLNASLRRIDLTCALLAPMVVSQLMAFSNIVSCFFLTSWNIVSLVIEYTLIKVVYNRVPALQQPKQISEDVQSGKVSWSLLAGWRVYYRQETFPAGLGLSLLYLTVLGFDNITVGYVFVQGMPEYLMGFMPALAGVVGVIGTLAYPRLARGIGLERTGLIGFGSEVACLTIAVASIWAPGSPFQPDFLFATNLTESVGTTTTSPNQEMSATNSFVSVALLLTGIILARFGLWIADLSVSQFQQELVPAGDLGIVNGVQHSMNMTMDMLKFALVVLLPWPQTFGFLALLSFFSVSAGWASYAVFSRKRRGHILPFHNLKCMTVADEDFNQNETTHYFGVRL